MRTGNLFTTRRKHLLIGAGIGLCLLAAPAGVAANGTQRSGPAHSSGAQQTLTPSHSTPSTAGQGANSNAGSQQPASGNAANQANCPSSIPSSIPDPVFGTQIGTVNNNQANYFNDAEAATVSNTLPAGFVGPGTGATTGTALNPVPASGFAIGFFDETELHESTVSSFPHTELAPVWPNASGTVKTDTGGLTHLANVFSDGGVAAYGTGQPYAAILTTDLSTILIGKVPTTVLDQNYTPNPTGGHVNYSGVQGNCGNGPLDAVVGFDVTRYSSILTPGKVYAAYILMADTDGSGPLANHLWYFTYTPVTPPNCYPSKSVSTGDGNAVASGTLLTYTVTVTNNGTAGECDVNDIDTLLGGGSLTNITVNAPTLGSFTPAAPTSIPFAWNIPSLGAGQTASFTMTANAIGTTAGSEVDNTATVITGCTATAAHPCSVTVHTPINPPPAGPECTPNKTASPSGSVPIGTVITYTVTVTNNGASPGDCAVQDVLSATTGTTINVTQLPVAPAGTSMTILNGACTPTQCSELPLTINWSVPGLAPGASKHFTMQVTVTGAGSTNSTISSASLNGTITNTATSTENCTTNCIIIVNNPVTFALSKSVSPTGTLTGPFPETVTYTVTLTNTSANPATTGVLVDDVLSGTAGFTVNDSSFKGPADMAAVTKVGDGHYQWTVPADDLPAGGSASVTFTASVTSASNQDTSTLANCLDSVTAGQLCADNVATALGMKVHVQNPLSPPPGSGVQAITTTPSTGITNEMNIAVAGFLFLGGLGLVLLGLLAKAPAVAPRRSL